MASFLDVLRVILILLGGDANALNGQVTTEQAMSVVQQRYAASGVPSTLSTGERILLHNTATLALAMLNSAPADVDSAAVASFRITLTDIAGRTVVPLPFGSESFSPATAP